MLNDSNFESQQLRDAAGMFVLQLWLERSGNYDVTVIKTNGDA